LHRIGRKVEELPGENTVPNEANGDPENSPIVAGYHGTKHRLTLPNGHLIQLGGADRWNRFAGSEFNAIWCDEVAHYENTDLYDLHEMLVTRQRTAEGPNVTLWTSTGNGFNQFYDITEREMEPTVDGEQPLSWRETLKVVVAHSLDNPFLNEKDKMRRQFGNTGRAEQALRGGFAAATGLVYPDFSRERHVRTDEALPPLRENWRAYGYDHGWDDPRVVLEVAQTTHDQLVVIDEFYRENVEYERAVEWVSNRPEGRVYAEHEPEHQQAFRTAGYPVEPATKDLDEGIPAVRNRLDWRDDPEDRPGLLVRDNCSNTIREFLDYQEEEVAKASAVDHALDSLRYVVMGEDGTTLEAGGGVLEL
jgi:hypothetical protein